MNMIKNIFHTDLKNLFKSFFALVIAGGVCFLPALYAWCNIYSNWDPYGNTANLKMAAVSLDKGYTDEDGAYHNAGDEIIEQLKENDKIDWQFVETDKEAITGVENGTYYGAVVVSEDFSYNMYDIFGHEVTKPQLIFYQNQKKNPVATKISDTVVETLQNNINEKFVKVMTTTIFEDANQLSKDIEEDGGVDALIEHLEDVNGQLKDYEKTIDALIQGNTILSSAITVADNDVTKMGNNAAQSAKSVGESQKSISTTEATLDSYTALVNGSLTSANDSLKSAKTALEEAKLANDAKAMDAALTKSVSDLDKTVTDLTTLSDAMNADPGLTVSSNVTQITNVIKEVQTVKGSISNAQTELLINQADEAFAANRAAMITDVDKAISSVTDVQNNMNNKLIPQVKTTLDSLNITLTNVTDLLNNVSSTLGSMGNVFDSLQVTIKSGSKSFAQTRDAIEVLSDRLEDTIDKVKAAKDSEKMKVLLNTLSGNPDLYGEFFAEPVQIETEVIYPVENYGSAVTPFYTVLAIWVGALILTAILKVKPNPATFPEAKDYEMYFGRYGIFFAMGQIQTLIIVLGDLFLLQVQCLHPFYFWFAAAMTGFTFSLLIYTLVLAFGDVGKAFAVVIVVIQIAGSSGTYPIELLPEFFQKLYIFFPFPYGINALRECIAGMYGHDYVIYLLELMIFVVASLVLGLWIRKPFKELGHFMEKRMEDTEML